MTNLRYKYVICQVFGRPFHGSNRGSNPRGDATNQINYLSTFCSNIRALAIHRSFVEYLSISRVFTTHHGSNDKQMTNSFAASRARGFSLISLIRKFCSSGEDPPRQGVSIRKESGRRRWGAAFDLILSRHFYTAKVDSVRRGLG